MPQEFSRTGRESEVWESFLDLDELELGRRPEEQCTAFHGWEAVAFISTSAPFATRITTPAAAGQGLRCELQFEGRVAQQLVGLEQVAIDA